VTSNPNALEDDQQANAAARYETSMSKSARRSSQAVSYGRDSNIEQYTKPQLLNN
jgi:hypothetical protein